MTSVGLSRHALAIGVAASMLMGCGGPQALTEPPSLSPPNVTGFMNTGTPHYRIIFSFGVNKYGYDGARPQAGVIDVKGTFYGTTFWGGPYGSVGTVFSVDPHGVEYILHAFGGQPDGSHPAASLINVNGTLYGTASEGGSSSDGGTVFRIGTNGANFRVLHTFSGGSDGTEPVAALTAVNGRLYGTTFGCCYSKGTIFSIRPDGTGFRTIHTFTGGSDGEYPKAPLTLANGMLYGTTSAGGAANAGTVFSISVGSTSKLRTLHTFNGTDGAEPAAGVLVALDGTVYGTTAGGGANNESGTVFRLTSNGKERVLHSFGSAEDGRTPLAGLTAIGGWLYGTTIYGGITGYGTVFRIRPNGTGERVMHNFNEHFKHDGIFPYGTLLAENEKLYGTTDAGGRSHRCLPSEYCDYGTVFALKP